MPTPDASELVGALRRTFGEHRGCRAAHAKGLVAAGTFTGSAGGARICRAEHLREGRTLSVIARFSNGSGYPDSPDWVRDRRGLAVKFGLSADLVSISHPIYFAREPQDLVDFSRMRLRDFLAAHPNAARAIEIAQNSPPPCSYARVGYHAVHAFGLLDDDGARRWARFHWCPEAGSGPLATAEARRRPPDYLRDELISRLTSGTPVRFELQIELAQPGDPTADATALWEGEREHVGAGTLQLDRLAPELDEADVALVFDPTNVPDGIELSADAVLHARAGAYRLSARERYDARNLSHGQG
jgi:catalase